MRRVLKFFRLRNCDRNALIQTFLLLIGIRLGLWLLPFQTLLRGLDNIGQSPDPTPSSPAHPAHPRKVGEIIWAVNISSRYMPGQVKCLARALITQLLLRRHNYDPQLRIGVAKTTLDQLEAHAWVELEGKVVMGQVEDLSRFTPMPALN
ncbi:MAG: lasso peptide biosynthesis B2 protein [Acaryochloris sp. RU_4_1]|nr:lasso peptide biosynthesis B2 protein [Acaryochloris sp. RU_4_1]NJR53350.1 lasso peptide biosynthesis B2 protein [Acaryochloris sp. CRU_2_0]